MEHDPSRHEPAILAAESPAVILFTSGTTAQAKGVVRDHGQLLASWQTWEVEALGLGPDDVHLAQLPLAHGFGFGAAMSALISGGTLVLLERFSPEPVLRLIGEEGVSVLHGTPAHFTLLLDHLDPARHDVSTLRIGMASAASFSPRLLRRILDELDMDLRLVYGSSEGLGVSTSDRGEILCGSVGRPVPDLVRILGSDGRPVPSGEIGEITFRRVHPVRYWSEPVPGRTPADPWYHTGDRGRIDADGLLYVLGRVKHQVNRGGIGIDPGEVEAVMASYPGLADAAAIGVADPVLGQIVCACVVPAGPHPPELAELRDFLGRRLARHKLPERLCVLGRIPRTSRGKVDHDALQAQAATATDVQHFRSP